MPALVELKEEMRKASLQAQTIVDDDKMTFAEKKEALDKVEADIKSFSEQINDLTRAAEEEQYLDAQRKRYAGLAEIVKPEEKGVDTLERVAMTMGDQITTSAEYKSILEKGNITSYRWSSGPVEMKATLTSAGAGGTTGGGVIVPDNRPGIVDILFRRLTVENLLPSGQTGSATVRYVKETAATNTAAAVAEAGLKPEATLTLATVDEPVRKIAETLKVTDELFADAPALRSYVDNRLMLFVDIATEGQLLTGDGTGANLTGILNRAGLTAAEPVGVAPDTVMDAIYREVTKIRVGSFLEPDAIVIHPNDWQAIRLSKDANDQYYGGGPFTGAYGNGGMAGDMLWGLRAVVTPAMTENTVLVGAFRTAAQIFNRSGMTVESTNSNENDFKHNLIALRAERRLALAVYRPAGFGTVTGA